MLKASKEEVENIIFILKKCGFNDLQCKKMILNYGSYYQRADHFEDKIKNFISVVTGWGYSEYEAIEILVNNPRTFTYSKKWLESNKDDVLNAKSRVSMASSSIEKMSFDELGSPIIKQTLLDYGFPSEFVENLDDSLSPLIYLHPEEFERAVKFFEEFLYTKEDIIRKTIENNSFLVYDEEFYNDRFEIFRTINISKYEIMEAYKGKFLALNNSKECLKRAIDWFLSKGYSKEQIRKMIFTQP